MSEHFVCPHTALYKHCIFSVCAVLRDRLLNSPYVVIAVCQLPNKDAVFLFCLFDINHGSKTLLFELGAWNRQSDRQADRRTGGWTAASLNIPTLMTGT